MTNNLIEYINYVDTVYQNKFVEIFSLTLESLYRSPKMQKVYDGLDEMNNDKPSDSLRFLSRFDQINHEVIGKKSPVKFLCLSHLDDDEALLGHGIRQPIILRQKVVGIFSVITPVKIFSFDPSQQSYVKRELCTSLKCEQNLSEIEEQILFLSSYGFTQGEIYEILKLDKNVSMHINSIDNVKYYYYALLKKFELDSLESIIDSISELKFCQFIPKSLFKTNKLITVN